jgi:hypothetical protein
MHRDFCNDLLALSRNLPVVDNNFVPPSVDTIQGLLNREILEHENGCLSNANLPKHSVKQRYSMIPGVLTENGMILGFVTGHNYMVQ